MIMIIKHVLFEGVVRLHDNRWRERVSSGKFVRIFPYARPAKARCHSHIAY